MMEWDDGWNGPPPLCSDCEKPLTGEELEHGAEGFGHEGRCCECYEDRERGKAYT